MPSATERDSPIRVDWTSTMQGSPTLQIRSDAVVGHAKSAQQGAVLWCQVSRVQPGRTDQEPTSTDESETETWGVR